MEAFYIFVEAFPLEISNAASKQNKTKDSLKTQSFYSPTIKLPVNLTV